jgi:hypothetical protein
MARKLTKNDRSYTPRYNSPYVPKFGNDTKIPLNKQSGIMIFNALPLTILDPIKVEDNSNLDEDIDELSERIVLNFSKGESQRAPFFSNGQTPKGTVHPTTPLPYSSNIQDNPFFRGRACSDFYSMAKAIEEKEEENRNLSLSPGLLRKSYQPQGTAQFTLITPLILTTESSLKQVPDGKRSLE